MHSRVTFVGLGNMGYNMAHNLIKGGFKVAGFDADKNITEKFIKESGGENFDSIESAVKESEAVITMLPNSKIVNSVWETASKTAKKATYFIDSSTISPIETLDLASRFKSKGFIPADAPVSGGVMGAKNATLSFMVGSDLNEFEHIKRYLNPMGKNFFHCGDNSKGQVAKVCNNLCLGITMVGLSESLALGVKLGMDPKILSGIMSVSSGRCWSLDTYNPIPNTLPNAPSNRNYENGFSMELISKDLNIALECAKNVDLEVEMSKMTLEHYESLKKKFPNKDFSYVYQYILANKKL
jgi:3-hydroxyisobutyrate dehydrogenase